MTTERLGTQANPERQALAATSIRSMLDHQVSSGAFIAAREFPHTTTPGSGTARSSLSPLTWPVSAKQRKGSTGG